MEIKEKIWKGAYIDMFELLCDTSEGDGCKEGKNCSHTRDCGHWLYRKRIEETIGNWVKAFSIFQAIISEKTGGLAGELACYQNRIMCAHDEFGGTAWRDYDKEFRRIKATRPTPGWDQIDVNSWVCIMKHDKKWEGGHTHPSRTGGWSGGPQPFRSGPGAPGSVGGNFKKGACWDFNQKSCTRPQGVCKFKHHCTYCGGQSHSESRCCKKHGA